MKARAIIIMFVMFAMTCIVAGQDQDIVKKNGAYQSQMQNKFIVKPGGNLVIRDVTADVEITTWNENAVHVYEKVVLNVFTKEEAYERVERWKQRFEQDGNTIYVRGNRDMDCDNCSMIIKVPQKFNLDLELRNGDVEISRLEGDIDVMTSGGDIEMKEIIGILQVRTSGGDLAFQDISGKISGQTSGGDIDLKDIYAEADVETSGGDVDVTNATKKTKLRTSGGDINVTKVSGLLNMSTSGGDINVQDYTGPKISFTTSGGDIELNNIHGELDARTSGGDIEGETLLSRTSLKTTGGEVELDDVRAAFRAESVGGDVTANVNITDFSVPHDIHMETVGGDVYLVIPANMPASIDAELRLSDRDREWDRNDIYSDFPLTKNMDKKKRILKCTGDINGGGDPIILRTVGGDIHIKKQ